MTQQMLYTARRAFWTAGISTAAQQQGFASFGMCLFSAQAWSLTLSLRFIHPARRTSWLMALRPHLPLPRPLCRPAVAGSAACLPLPSGRRQAPPQRCWLRDWSS